MERVIENNFKGKEESLLLDLVFGYKKVASGQKDKFEIDKGIYIVPKESSILNINRVKDLINQKGKVQDLDFEELMELEMQIYGLNKFKNEREKELLAFLLLALNEAYFQKTLSFGLKKEKVKIIAQTKSK